MSRRKATVKENLEAGGYPLPDPFPLSVEVMNETNGWVKRETLPLVTGAAFKIGDTHVQVTEKEVIVTTKGRLEVAAEPRYLPMSRGIYRFSHGEKEE